MWACLQSARWQEFCGSAVLLQRWNNIHYPSMPAPKPGERLVGELAPELAPMLAALEMPANFVPTTNAVLAEMRRRGISRDTILSELRRMGAEIPGPSVQMLQVPFLLMENRSTTASGAGLLADRVQMHSTRTAACVTCSREICLITPPCWVRGCHDGDTVTKDMLLKFAHGDGTAVGGQGGRGRAHHQRLQHGVHQPHAGGGAGLVCRVAHHHQLRQLLPRVHRRAGAAALVACQSVATLLKVGLCPDGPTVA